MDIRRRGVAFGDLEANAGGILVAPPAVVHREDETIEVGEFGGDRVAQIGREGRNPALARRVIAENRDRADGSQRDDLQ